MGYRLTSDLKRSLENGLINYRLQHVGEEAIEIMDTAAPHPHDTIQILVVHIDLVTWDSTINIRGLPDTGKYYKEITESDSRTVASR